MVKDNETTIELLDRLYAAGDLDLLVKTGIVPSHILKWRNMYHTFLNRLSATGSRIKARDETAALFSCSKSAVEKACRQLKK